MKRLTAETATKMQKLANLSTYQGRITYLVIAFICQTGATYGEAARLLVGEACAHGRPKKYARLLTMPKCAILLNPAAQKTVKLVLEVQGQHGLIPHPVAPLFRMHSGRAFTADQLASLLWMYRQAAEL